MKKSLLPILFLALISRIGGAEPFDFDQCSLALENYYLSVDELVSANRILEKHGIPIPDKLRSEQIRLSALAAQEKLQKLIVSLNGELTDSPDALPKPDYASASKEKAEAVGQLRRLRGDDKTPTEIRDEVALEFKQNDTAQTLVKRFDGMKDSDAEYPATLEELRYYYMYLRSGYSRR